MQGIAVRGHRGFACLAATVFCAFACASARSETAAAVTASIGGTSDFVFRGLSYTRGDPAAQGSLDVEIAQGAYAGTFVSTTNPNAGPSPNMEIDLWAGYHHAFNDSLSADLRYTHYMYPDDPRVADYDRNEFTATLGVRNVLFLSASYSPDTEAVGAAPPHAPTGDEAWALEFSVQHVFTPRWSVSLGAGRYLLEEVYGDDYTYWGVTLVANLAPVELDFSVLGTDSTAERLFTSHAAGERFAFTVLYRFTLSK
ncbi:MAG TPA: TorF family putative porin [Povalibacter sp.]|nr:TorF family putative porin [Povalibacter sp.]